MQVITGAAKGTRLVTPQGEAVRPTSSRAKEGLFSSIQFEITGSRVLDLYCGSGQLGIEALSRGAVWAVFVDNCAQSLAAVRQNLAAARLSDKARVQTQEAASYVSRCKEQFDIVFMDPPYSNLAEGSRLLSKVALLVDDSGVIFYETARDAQLPHVVGDFALYKRYNYGQSSISAYRFAQSGQ